MAEPIEEAINGGIRSDENAQNCAEPTAKFIHFGSIGEKCGGKVMPDIDRFGPSTNCKGHINQC